MYYLIYFNFLQGLRNVGLTCYFNAALQVSYMALICIHIVSSIDTACACISVCSYYVFVCMYVHMYVYMYVQ